jgi:hypothetical protein
MMKLRYSYLDGGIHPILGQIFYWQQEAFGGEESNRYKQYLCEVLGAVAQGVEDCDRILRHIHAVESGEIEEIKTGGNDVTLTLRKSGVQVDINITESWIGQPEGHFTIHEWQIALEGWRHFLEMPESLDSVVEVDL